MTVISYPSLVEITANYRDLQPHIISTPVVKLQHTTIKPAYAHDSEVLLKLECFQRTGSFKVRGALTILGRAKKDDLKRGVVAVSAGNHGAAVAYAARQYGVPCKVFIMSPANPFRVSLCRSLGADVTIVDTDKSAFEEARRLVAKEGCLFIHPFEGHDIALGTASVGVEFLEQSPDIDVLVIAIGGGGLAAGVSCAAKQLNPTCKVFGVEPFGADSMWRSLQAGKPEALTSVNTIADSLGAPNAEPYSYSLCRTFIDDVVRISDDDICAAMYQLFVDAKLAVEPAGAAALAALNGPLQKEIAGKRVGIVVCGANIDPYKFSEYLHRGAP